MGASYGYKLLWVIILAALASFFYQLPAIRVALAKEVTIMEAVRMRFGKIWAMVLYYCIMFGYLIFQAGNFTGAAMAMNYFVPQISLIAWAAIMIGLAFVLAWTSRYGILESFTKVLVILMVVAFVATAIGSQPNMSSYRQVGSRSASDGMRCAIRCLSARTRREQHPRADRRGKRKGRISGNEIWRHHNTDGKSTRLNSSHITRSRMPSSA